MAWIESHQSLGEHPKTKKLCRVLGIGKAQAIGHLHMLWWWSMDYAQDGDLTRYESLDIAIGAEWEGDEDTFVDALVSAGFVDRDANGIRVHDWHDYVGKLIERRAKNAARMREARAPYDAGTNKPRATHVQGTQRARATLPNRTKPNHTVPTKPSPNGDIEPVEFVEFWQRYPKGRGSRHKSLAAWKKVRREHAAIMAGLESWLRSEQWQKGMVKTCELWLRDRLWENPPDPPSGFVDADAEYRAWMNGGAAVAPEHRRR